MENILSVLFEFFFKIILFYFFVTLINFRKVIIIDNLINESLYQDNQDFSKNETNFKILAIYFPLYYTEKFYPTNKMDNNFAMSKNEEININKSIIEQQVKLAKNHGIFGFGIVYNIINGIYVNEAILDLFMNDNLNNFPFFIIINLDNNYCQQNQSFLNQNITYSNNYISTFIESIKKYLSSDNYINLIGKPLLGIFHSLLSSELIRKIRSEYKNNIYIISISYENKKSDYLNLTNSFIVFPSQNIGLESNLNQYYFYNFYYPKLIKEKKIESKKITNFFIINRSLPEKFYIIFRKFLNITNQRKYSFILFNAWNNYQDNFYLEPDKEFGFAYLNYLSKAIFNINTDVFYNLELLKDKSRIAIQVHLFYEDLINDIINKTNNIPVKFDLYISITSQQLKNHLEKSIKRFSNTNYFEILMVENKGRDILPFLNQIKKKFKLYKYLCHIHTKKSLTAPEIGFLWRNYLYDNLLGNINIVSEILHDFEINEKLGFLFPETFYKIIQQFYLLTNGTKKWMDSLASKLFPNHIIGEPINFPAGNMFWARIKAIFQIFIYDFSKYFPNEDDQTNDTIMHGIERIWLYLVKYNDYYYKTIFKFF